MPNSGVVDERILEMQIDHDKFERGAKKTLNILEKLDLGLKAIGKNNADGFDSVASALDKVTQRFSALGIAGDQIIRTLTNKAIGLVEQMGHVAKSLSIDQITAGWDKYGEKTQGVQTIMAATAKDWNDQAAQMDYVNAQLEKLNWFTDETSYNFLDMVNNIGKFTSNGVKLETAVTAMEGISTWAAMSGANVGEASRAMYNLSQALATGSVKLIDWKSIENANMATREFKETALETAASLGTLTKVGEKWKTKSGKIFSTEQFNTQLSEGWFSSDVLLETLNKYGTFTDVLNEATEATGLTATEMLKEIDAYEEGKKVTAELIPWVKKLSSEEYALGRRAFAAAQEAKTYADALNATKDAVSTGWMNLFETMFGNYLTAKKFWTDVANSLYEIFAEPINWLNEIFDYAFNGANPLKDSLADVGYTLYDMEEAAKKIADDTSEQTYGLDNLIEQYGSVEAAIKAGAVSAEQFQKILDQMNADRLYSIVNGKNDAFNQKIEEIKQNAEWYKNGAITKETLEARGYDMAMIEWWANIIGKETKDAKATAKAIRSENDKSKVDYKKAKAYLEKNDTSFEDVETAAVSLGDAELDKIIKKYGSFKKAVKEGVISVDQFQTVLSSMQGESTDPYLVQFMDQYADQLLHLAGYTDEDIEKIKELGLTADEVLGGMTDEKVTRAEGFKLFTESLLNLLSVFEDISSAILNAFNIVFGGTDDSETATERIGEKLYALVKRFNEFTTSIQLSKEQITELTNGYVDFLNGVQDAKGIFSFIFSIASKLGGILRQIIGAVKDSGIIGSIFRSIKLVLEGLAAPLKVVFDYFTDLFGEHTWTDSLTTILGRLGVSLNAIAYKFKAFMTDSKTLDWITAQLDRITGFVSRLVNAFKQNGLAGVFNELSQMLNNFLARHPTLQKIYNIIVQIVDIAKVGFAYVKQFFGSIANAFKGIDISGLFTDFSFEKLMTVIRQLASAVGTIIVDIFSNLFSESGPLSKIKGLIGPALLVLIGHGILSTIKKVKKVIGGFGDIIENVVGFTKRLKTGPSKFKEFARNLLMIAISIGILAGSLVALSKLNLAQLATGIAGMVAIMAMLVGMSRLAKSVKAKGFSGFLALAVSVLILAMTLKSLAKLTPAQLVTGIVAMVAIMAMLVGMSRLAKSVKAKGFSAFLALAVSVLIIAMTLKSLAQLTPAQLVTGIVAMVAIMAMLVGMSRLTKSVKAKGFGQLILLALSLVIVAGAMALLAQFSWQSLLAAAAAMVIGVIALAGMAIVIQTLSKVPISTVAKGLAVLAIIVGGIALIVWGLVELGSLIVDSAIKLAGKLKQFADSLKPFIDSISGFDEGTSASFKTFAAMMKEIMVAEFWTMLASLFAKLGDSDALASKLTSFISGLKPFLADVTLVTADTVTGAGYLASTMSALLGAQITSDIGGWINGLNGDNATKLSEFMINLEGFVSSVGTVTEDAVTGTGYLASMMSALLGAQITSDIGSLFDGLNGENAAKLSDFMANLEGFLTTVSGIDQSKLDGASNLSSIMKSALGANFWTMIGGWFSGNNATYAQQLSDFTSALIPFINNMASIDSTMLTNVDSVFTTLATLTQSNVIQLFGSQLQSFYKNLEGNRTSGLFGGEEGLVERDMASFQTAVTSISEFVTALSNLKELNVSDDTSFFSIGSTIMSSIAGGVSDNRDTVKGAIVVAVRGAVILATTDGGLVSITNSMGQPLGRNIGSGIANGIAASTAMCVAAAVSLATSINNAFAGALQIHSPSRVFARLGAFIPAGVAKGIEENTGVAEESIVVMSSAVLAAMQQAMLSVATIADDSFEYNPMITPVVDMSNVTAAAGSAGGMFGNVGMALRASSRVSMDTAQNTAAAVTYGGGAESIVSELQRMGSRLDNLGDAITNMKIVLDSGELVGATSRQMDDAFGVLQMHKGRGN